MRGKHPSRWGNKKLKRALLLSAFAAPHHPPSRAYYDANVPRVNGIIRQSLPWLGVILSW